MFCFESRRNQESRGNNRESSLHSFYSFTVLFKSKLTQSPFSILASIENQDCVNLLLNSTVKEYKESNTIRARVTIGTFLRKGRLLQELSHDLPSFKQIYKDFKSLKVTGKKCGCIIILLTETVLLSRSSTLG